MFSLIKPVSNELLSFSIYLARERTTFLFLNDEPYLVRPTLIDLNPAEPKYYLFMISLNKCTGNCNVLSPKVSVAKETKDTNVKVFNMVTNKNQSQTMTKQTSCDCKCKSIVQHVIQTKIGIAEYPSVNVNFIISAKMILVGIPTHVFVRKVNI